MASNFDNAQEAFSKMSALREAAVPKIVEEAKKLYKPLPSLTVLSHQGNIIGVDPKGRRWILYGHWNDGWYVLETIIRETRRGKGMNWLIGGQADKNCKNVWSPLPNGIEGRLYFHEVQQAIELYSGFLLRLKSLVV